jgi:hypothetical protein
MEGTMAGSAARIVLVGTLVGIATALAEAANQTAEGRCGAPPPPSQIRPSTCKLAQAVAAGMNRSPTFRELIDQVKALSGIVYINPGHDRQAGNMRPLAGALQHRVIRAGTYRFLYITVMPDTEEHLAITIAHELQHAVEVLQSDAATEADIDALFARIGAAAGAWISETTAAIEAERTVRRELSVNRGQRRCQGC